jgi:NAD+ kinase
MKIVLFTNKSKDPDGKLTDAAAAILRGAGADCAVYGGCGDVFNGAYAAVSIGGDGTFLRCAQYAAPKGVAVIGVHLGHTGYLSRICPDNLEELRGIASFSVKKRSVLQTESQLAVNDITFSRGAEVQAVSLELRIDGHAFGSYLGDGVIVSSAMGSTGYSLSAGGPVVDPGVNAVIVTPICAHTSRAHSFVLAPDRVLTVEPLSVERRPIYISADGGVPRRLEPGESVDIRVSETPLLCLEPEGGSFLDNVKIHRL